MAARRDEECGAAHAEEHGHDHRDIRQVRAAGVRRVQRKDIARLHVAAAPPHDFLHGLAHRAQVHRHVRRVGDELSLRVEQRAGEIEALLDVHRAARCWRASRPSARRWP